MKRSKQKKEPRSVYLQVSINVVSGRVELIVSWLNMAEKLATYAIGLAGPAKHPAKMLPGNMTLALSIQKTIHERLKNLLGQGDETVVGMAKIRLSPRAQLENNIAMLFALKKVVPITTNVDSGNAVWIV